jgi:hypothetical protein
MRFARWIALHSSETRTKRSDYPTYNLDKRHISIIEKYLEENNQPRVYTLIRHAFAEVRTGSSTPWRITRPVMKKTDMTRAAMRWFVRSATTP